MPWNNTYILNWMYVLHFFYCIWTFWMRLILQKKLIIAFIIVVNDNQTMSFLQRKCLYIKTKIDYKILLLNICTLYVPFILTQNFSIIYICIYNTEILYILSNVYICIYNIYNNIPLCVCVYIYGVLFSQKKEEICHFQ